MENLNAEEDQGVDVRGIVPWDDGLTNKERARGGRDVAITGKMVMEAGGEAGEDLDEFAKRRREEQEGGIPMPQGDSDVEPPRKRKPKRWLGIWE